MKVYYKVHTTKTGVVLSLHLYRNLEPPPPKSDMDPWTRVEYVLLRPNKPLRHILSMLVSLGALRSSQKVGTKQDVIRRILE